MWIPRIIGRAEYFENAGDCATLAATQVDFYPLAQRQAPGRRDFISKLRNDGWRGLVARIESKTALVFGHASKR